MRTRTVECPECGSPDAAYVGTEDRTGANPSRLYRCTRCGKTAEARDFVVATG